MFFIFPMKENILITGSSGYVGTHLIKKLLQIKKDKYNIIGIDIVKPSFKSKYFKHLNFDIEKIKYEKYISNNIDYIIHLGAVSHDKDFKKNPLSSYSINLNSTLKILDFAKKNNVKNFIFSSTEWVYGENNKKKLLSEEMQLNFENLSSDYAKSKLICEKLIQSAHMNKEILKFQILRFGIIYGPREKATAVEGIFNEIYNSQTIEINGSMNNSKKYIHIDDLVNAIIKSLNISNSNILNICHDYSYKISDIIKLSTNLLHKKNLSIKNKNKNYSNSRNPSNLKAKNKLRWKPKFTLGEGMKDIYEKIYKN